LTKIAVIIVPHEDDMEVLCYHSVYNLIQSGYHIIEVVMTDGRYGLEVKKFAIPKKPEFAGERLIRIRARELKNAAKTWGQNSEGKDHVESICLNYVDGFLPLNYRSIAKVKDIILEYKPDIIIGMDPFFAIDHHHDHINAGRNYYFALKSLNPNQRPKKMYMIQSYKNDTYIPLGSFKLQEKIENCYKSQFKPLLIHLMVFGTKLVYFIRSPVSRGRPCAGLRKVTFNAKDNTLITLRERMFDKLDIQVIKTTTFNYLNMYLPLPKIGTSPDEINPRDFANINEKSLPKFYFGKKYENKRVKTLNSSII
jgi:LmbE family N-acetylglucosaminyl deacetylase